MTATKWVVGGTEEFIIDMKRGAYRTVAMKLRSAAVFTWVLAGILAIVTILMAAAWKNPWIVKELDASDTSIETMETIAESHSPYVKISNVDLTFTGFYEVGSNDKIISYCYMAAIGDEYVLVDMPVTDGGALAQDSSSEGSILSGETIEGEVQTSTNMEKWLADDEDLTVDEYSSKYHVTDIEVHVYHDDRERVRIYQLMVLVLALGFAAVGAILRSESNAAEKERII